MTGRIDVVAPATMTVVNGATVVSSLLTLPPYGITVTDPTSSDTLTVTVIAANTGATLSASASGGATVTAHGNTLSLTGTAAQVNLALAGFVLLEPATVTTDRLSLTATDPSVLPASTDIAVKITQAGTPAFASPPASLNVQPNALAVLPGLVPGDPAASALAAAAQGQTQTLEITLSVTSGILLLPGLSATSGIVVSGQGTGTVSLIFTADQLAKVNAALAGLTYAGPGGTRLSYAMRNLSGPLGSALTSGQVTLTAAGSAGANGTFTTGGDTVILGSGAGGLRVSGLTADTGALSGSIFIGAAGTLEMPGGVLSLSGTSEDFGSLAAGSLAITGTAILAEGATIGGEISLGAGALADFAGTLIGGASASSPNQPELTLAPTAILTGNGTLIAGNTAEPGLITGGGTLLAVGGDTLLLAAGSISGGAKLLAAGGAVLALGTAAAVDSSVTLEFEPAYGIAPITGGYADSLAQNGGVIVINDPLAMHGTITGFTPGDRLVLPGLTALTLSSVTGQSFVVTGRNSANQIEQFTLHAAIPNGATLETGTDSEGDAEISLRATGAEIFVDGSSFASTQIAASAGVGQTLLGLSVLVPSWTSQSLTLTLSVANGVLAYGTVTPESTLVLTAASPTALNALLSALVYTATLSASSDTLTASSSSGLLSGLNSSVPISIEAGGTISGFTQAPTNEQTVLFSGSTASLNLVTAAAAPGAVIVSGGADFADVLAIGGIGGTALSVDGGGSAIFDAGSAVTLAADAVIGDAGGAGTIGILSTNFVVGTAGATADLIIGGNSAAAGSVAEITGAVTVAGDLMLGGSAAALLELSGSLDAAVTTIGAEGSLIGSGDALAAFGDLADSGMLVLENTAQATAQQLVLAGQLTLGGGTSLTGLSSAVIANGGSLNLGQDAVLSAFGVNAVGGSVLDQGSLLVAGNLASDAAISLAGGFLEAAAVTLNGGVLSGYGDVVTNAKIALAGGEILASGGLLALDGNVTMSNGGSIVIAGSSALDLIHGAGGEISFAGSAAVLTINDPAVESSAVTGMLAGDVIDLIGIATSLVSYANGTVTARDASGNALGSFALAAATGQPSVSIVSDGDGGALLTLGGELACFARGTRLLTPNGYVPVEAFKPGDPVINRFGIRRAVRWIGRRNLEIDARTRQDIRPVLIRPGAFGPGLPSRPVRLSPSHAVFVDNVLVPVMHLVNGATILREPRQGGITYFHIELDRHDVLMAEGLPVESYIDTGNRGEFHQELGIRARAAKPCAKLVTGGPLLARIRRRLHEITLQAGFTLAHEPELQGIVGKTILQPEIRLAGAVHVARFDLPRGAEHLTLRAHSAAPADTDPDSDDRRELAVCLRQPRPKRQRLQLGAGWYAKAPGDAGIWMSGSGEIFLPPGATELRLDLLAVAQSWRQPGLDLEQSRF